MTGTTLGDYTSPVLTGVKIAAVSGSNDGKPARRRPHAPAMSKSLGDGKFPRHGYSGAAGWR